MAKKIYGTFAPGVAIILALAFAPLPNASAINDQSRRNSATRQRVKARRKPSRQRISYACPMHLDIRSNSHGKCPKCLMDLVAVGRDKRMVRR